MSTSDARESDSPGWPPPDRPDLRTIRYRYVADGLIERWEWPRGGKAWSLLSTHTRAELDAGAERFIDRRPLTAAELEYARKFAQEQGWI